MSDSSDSSAILAAAEAGDAAAVGQLLKKSPRLVRSRNKWHDTPLHLAANVPIARLLIDHGANVNSRSWMGATPLHRASSAGRADVVELLIQNGANVRARRPERGDTALHWAATEEVARLLKDENVDVYARDKTGRTPLHWAAQSGHTDAAKYLIEGGPKGSGGQRGRGPKSHFVLCLLCYAGDLSSIPVGFPLERMSIPDDVTVPYARNGGGLLVFGDDGPLVAEHFNVAQPSPFKTTSPWRRFFKRQVPTLVSRHSPPRSGVWCRLAAAACGARSRCFVRKASSGF